MEPYHFPENMAEIESHGKQSKDEINTNALNSFKFAPLTLSHSPVGRARGEGKLSQMSKLFLRLY
jgi:hypothetical protein